MFAVTVTVHQCARSDDEFDEGSSMFTVNYVNHSHLGQFYAAFRIRRADSARMVACEPIASEPDVQINVLKPSTHADQKQQLFELVEEEYYQIKLPKYRFAA